MIILLTAINERIGAYFVGAFEDNKGSEILELSQDVRLVAIICIDYLDERHERLKRIDLKTLIHYEKYGTGI